MYILLHLYSETYRYKRYQRKHPNLSMHQLRAFAFVLFFGNVVNYEIHPGKEPERLLVLTRQRSSLAA